MNKLAIFVEGQTEQIFTEKLVHYLGSARHIGIQIQRIRGGGRGSPRMAIEISGTHVATHQDYFILLIDCGQDERVKSDILERYDGLVANGYRGIIGIRDVSPSTRDTIQQLRHGLAFRLPKDPVEPLFVLAVMEIEAWFLAEYSHFTRLHPRLTLDRIEQSFGFHPGRDDMQLRDYPSKDLENIYFLEIIEYHKSRQHVERTVNSLDFDTIANELHLRIHDLGNLVNTIKHFFD